MLILTVPFYSAPDDELYLGVSEGRENLFQRLGVPKRLTATRRLPPHPRNGLKRARKERDRPKQPQSHAPRSPRHRCVSCSSPKGQVGPGKPSHFGGRATPNRIVLPLPSRRVFYPQIRGKQPALHSQQTFCTQFYLCVVPEIMNTGRSPNSHDCTLASPHKTVISQARLTSNCYHHAAVCQTQSRFAASFCGTYWYRAFKPRQEQCYKVFSYENCNCITNTYLPNVYLLSYFPYTQQSRS